MGREIYTTNDQLGGPMIMFPNGVSHLLADTHFDSVKKAISWLSFVPAMKGYPLPIRDLSPIDSISRVVEFAPSKGLPYDPRHLLTGVSIHGYGNTNWQSGFLDRDSFIESLSGWAKTVVVGRGRLGGIPIGVIVTENRTAEVSCHDEGRSFIGILPDYSYQSISFHGTLLTQSYGWRGD